MKENEIRAFGLLWLLALFQGVVVSAMPNLSNGPSHLLMSLDRQTLYLFLLPLFHTDNRAGRAKLLVMRLGAILPPLPH